MSKLPSKHPLEPTRWYPYIVPDNYAPQLPDAARHSVERPLGHGLVVSLVQDQDGLVEALLPQELSAIGTSVVAAHEKATKNLESLLASQRIKSTVYEKGPLRKPFAVIGPHWAAASCLLVPGVWKMVQKAFGDEPIVASIPHRDVLLLFPKPAEGVAEIQSFVKEHESNGRKPLTFGLFEWGDVGPTPFVRVRIG